MKIAVPLVLIALIGIHDSLKSDFDHEHTIWNSLTVKHVKWFADGTASRVDYAAFKKDREELNAYLTGLSEIDKSTFDSWSKNQRLSFLINAYNAFTIELILTKYPDLKSIKESLQIL